MLILYSRIYEMIMLYSMLNELMVYLVYTKC